MQIWTYALLMLAAIAGCAADHGSATAGDEQGLTEIRVDSAALLAASVTRVEVEADGVAQDLVLNEATGTFDGTLILSSGSRTLVARAFTRPFLFFETLVGESQPVAVEVQPGVVTRVVIRILALEAQPQQQFGPIIDSLSFPTTTQAEAQATFAISVVDPGGGGASVTWSSDCSDAAFSAPNEATTTFAKPTPGACEITVVASAAGFSVAESFVIVVFPAGANSGAVTVSSSFVTAPEVTLSLPGLNCSVTPGSNGSCSTTIASPATTPFVLGVLSWGGSTPGTLEISESCGGRLGRSGRSPSHRSGDWLPPVAGGLCILTARAVSGDGLTTIIQAAVLVRPGSPATALPPVPTGRLFQPVFCTFTDATPSHCGTLRGGAPATLIVNTFLPEGHPGSVEVTDECAGPLPEPTSFLFPNSPFAWTIPDEPGRTCTLRVLVTNLEGSSSEIATQYVIGAP